MNDRLDALGAAQFLGCGLCKFYKLAKENDLEYQMAAKASPDSRGPTRRIYARKDLERLKGQLKVYLPAPHPLTGTAAAQAGTLFRTTHGCSPYKRPDLIGEWCQILEEKRGGPADEASTPPLHDYDFPEPRTP